MTVCSGNLGKFFFLFILFEISTSISCRAELRWRVIGQIEPPTPRTKTYPRPVKQSRFREIRQGEVSNTLAEYVLPMMSEIQRTHLEKPEQIWDRMIANTDLARVFNRFFDKGIDLDSVILGLEYFEKIRQENPDLQIDPFSIESLLLLCVTQALKYREDHAVSIISFAQVGSISSRRYKLLEVEFLNLINFDLFISNKRLLSPEPEPLYPNYPLVVPQGSNSHSKNAKAEKNEKNENEKNGNDEKDNKARIELEEKENSKPLLMTSHIPNTLPVAEYPDPMESIYRKYCCLLTGDRYYFNEDCVCEIVEIKAPPPQPAPLPIPPRLTLPFFQPCISWFSNFPPPLQMIEATRQCFQWGSSAGNSSQEQGQPGSYLNLYQRMNQKQESQAPENFPHLPHF